MGAFRARRSTIYDVAAAANVSPMTVSLALRPTCGRSRMTSLTRNRILEVAQRMKFRPHPAAKGLRVGRTNNIGFYINRPEYLNLSIPSWHRVISAMLDRLWRHGYQLGFYFFEPDNREGFDEFLTPHEFVDGIVVQGRNLTAREIHLIRRSKLRVVSLYEKIDGFCSLEVDEFQAGQMAAEYLHAHGHRQVAVLSQRLPVERWGGRVNGFLERAAELGMDTSPRLRFFLNHAESVVTDPAWGRELFAQYRASGTKTRCLYVPSDYLSFGVVAAADELGWQLGRDVSVLSYDNLEGVSRGPWATARLTTFDLPFRAIGETAASFLVEGTDGKPYDFHLFQPKLIERGSVANER